MDKEEADEILLGLYRFLVITALYWTGSNVRRIVDLLEEVLR